MNVHIIKDIKYLDLSDLEAYASGDLVIMAEAPIGVFKVIGSRMENKYLDNITNNDHKLILESTSYEAIVREIEQIHSFSAIDLLHHNKNISVTEEQVKTLSLLKEMI